MSSVQRHGKGFRVTYRQPGDKKLRTSPTFATAGEAEAWMLTHLVDARPTYATILDAWRQELPSTHRQVASERVLALVRGRDWSNPLALREADLRAFLLQGGDKRSCAYLLTVLRWAARWRHLPINADVLRYRLPASARRAPAALLTDGQAASIQECAWAMGPRAGAIIDYLLTYGARPITACRLQVRHLDAAACELVLPDEKHSGGWRHRITPEHLDLWASLPRWEPPKGTPADALPMFPHYLEDRAWRLKNGSAGELASWFKNTIGKRLKLGPTTGIYQLKRYAITRLLRLTSDPATVASFTGHRDLEQVMTYARTNSQRQDQALSLLVTKPVTMLPNKAT